MPYGVKGWMKLHSYTDPIDNILAYQPLYMADGQGWQPIEFDQHRAHGKGLVVHVAACDDRDKALLLVRRELACSAAQLPTLEESEFYWRDLEGMQVLTRWQGAELVLGDIAWLFASGANDVMVVQATEQSIDERERLIPWVLEHYVLEIDPLARRVIVEWDPSF